MHSTPHHPRRRWDGSHTTNRPHRSLRLAPTAGSPLLRAGQVGRCRDCGNLIEWYHRPDHRPVPLHPKELPVAYVPLASRWHVSSGIAYAAGDGTDWCRLPHAVLCPARTTESTTPHLATLRRGLAARTRHLIDTGRFTPRQRDPATHRPCRPTRPVAQILGIRYLSAHPVEDLQCLARANRTRTRCPRAVADPSRPAGVWRLLPVTASTGQLALPGKADMAVYDLTGLPYGEQLRWRAQRCPHHEHARAELAVSDWEPFDPLIHHEHVHTRLPDQTPQRPRPARPTGRCHYT